MGMYTAISLGIELRKDTPEEVIDTIEYMTSGRQENNAIAYAQRAMHPLFGDTRWPMLLCCDSYYFDWQTRYTWTYDSISKSWYLSGVSNLKNYSNEINLFLDWLQPHIETFGFIGWKMYEEDEIPTMLFNDKENGRILELTPDRGRSLDDIMTLCTPINAETWE